MGLGRPSPHLASLGEGSGPKCPLPPQDTLAALEGRPGRAVFAKPGPPWEAGERWPLPHFASAAQLGPHILRSPLGLPLALGF